jgi:hypothetical protein
MLTTLAAPGTLSSLRHCLSLEIKLRVETAMCTRMYKTNKGVVVGLCAMRNCQMDSNEQTQQMSYHVLRVS